MSTIQNNLYVCMDVQNAFLGFCNFIYNTDTSKKELKNCKLKKQTCGCN